MTATLIVVIWTLLLTSTRVSGGDLYPYGLAEGDTALFNDGLWIAPDKDMKICAETYSTYQIKRNGLVMFEDNNLGSDPQSLPLVGDDIAAFVAVFWADHDPTIGTVWYRYTADTDDSLMQTLDDDMELFNNCSNRGHKSGYALVVTWEDVGYAGDHITCTDMYSEFMCSCLPENDNDLDACFCLEEYDQNYCNCLTEFTVEFCDCLNGYDLDYCNCMWWNNNTELCTCLSGEVSAMYCNCMGLYGNSEICGCYEAGGDTAMCDCMVLFGDENYCNCSMQHHDYYICDCLNSDSTSPQYCNCMAEHMNDGYCQCLEMSDPSLCDCQKEHCPDFCQCVLEGKDDAYCSCYETFMDPSFCQCHADDNSLEYCACMMLYQDTEICDCYFSGTNQEFCQCMKTYDSETCECLTSTGYDYEYCFCSGEYDPSFDTTNFCKCVLVSDSYTCLMCETDSNYAYDNDICGCTGDDVFCSCMANYNYYYYDGGQSGEEYCNCVAEHGYSYQCYACYYYDYGWYDDGYCDCLLENDDEMTCDCQLGYYDQDICDCMLGGGHDYSYCECQVYSQYYDPEYCECIMSGNNEDYCYCVVYNWYWYDYYGNGLDMCECLANNDYMYCDCMVYSFGDDNICGCLNQYDYYDYTPWYWYGYDYNYDECVCDSNSSPDLIEFCDCIDAVEDDSYLSYVCLNCFGQDNNNYNYYYYQDVYCDCISSYSVIDYFSDNVCWCMEYYHMSKEACECLVNTGYDYVDCLCNIVYSDVDYSDFCNCVLISNDYYNCLTCETNYGYYYNYGYCTCDMYAGDPAMCDCVEYWLYDEATCQCLLNYNYDYDYCFCDVTLYGHDYCDCVYWFGNYDYCWDWYYPDYPWSDYTYNPWPYYPYDSWPYYPYDSWPYYPDYYYEWQTDYPYYPYYSWFRDEQAPDREISKEKLKLAPHSSVFHDKRADDSAREEMKVHHNGAGLHTKQAPGSDWMKDVHGRSQGRVNQKMPNHEMENHNDERQNIRNQNQKMPHHGMANHNDERQNVRNPNQKMPHHEMANHNDERQNVRNPNQKMPHHGMANHNDERQNVRKPSVVNGDRIREHDPHTEHARVPETHKRHPSGKPSPAGHNNHEIHTEFQSKRGLGEERQPNHENSKRHDGKKERHGSQHKRERYDHSKPIVLAEKAAQQTKSASQLDIGQQISQVLDKLKTEAEKKIRTEREVFLTNTKVEQQQYEREQQLDLRREQIQGQKRASSDTYAGSTKTSRKANFKDGEISDCTNTYQMVIAGSSKKTFLYLKYRDICWTTGDSSGGTDGLGGNIANVGMSALGAGFEHPYGQTSQIFDLVIDSNVYIDGTWIYQINGKDIRLPDCLLWIDS